MYFNFSESPEEPAVKADEPGAVTGVGGVDSIPRARDWSNYC